jgi:hypothetical protein
VSAPTGRTIAMAIVVAVALWILWITNQGRHAESVSESGAMRSDDVVPDDDVTSGSTPVISRQALDGEGSTVAGSTRQVPSWELDIGRSRVVVHLLGAGSCSEVPGSIAESRTQPCATRPSNEGWSR